VLVKAGPGAIPVEKSNNEDSVDSSVSNQRHQRPLGPAAIPSSFEGARRGKGLAKVEASAFRQRIDCGRERLDRLMVELLRVTHEAQIAKEAVARLDDQLMALGSRLWWGRLEADRGRDWQQQRATYQTAGPQ
jgi:hypothetical protein